MTDCEQFEELISAELDSMLSAEETASLSAHLENCESCRLYRDSLRAVFGSGLPLVEPPTDFTDAVMNRVHEESAKKKILPFHRRFNRYFGIAVAAVFLAVVGVSGILSKVSSSNSAAFEARALMSLAEPAAPAGQAKEGDAAVTSLSEETEEMDSAVEVFSLANSELPEEAMPAPEAEELLSSDSVEHSPLFSAAAALPEGVLAESIPWELPDRDADYYLEKDGVFYRIWLENDLVFWQEDGKDAGFLSPMSAPDFLAFMR